MKNITYKECRKYGCDDAEQLKELLQYLKITKQELESPEGQERYGDAELPSIERDIKEIETLFAKCS